MKATLEEQLEAKENIINHLADRNIELKKCYDHNLQLCKWQEQQINRLATAIEKIAKLVEGTYEALDSQALKEIRQIIKEQTNENK